MATKLSNREATKQQFSDGTTIDGNRVEDAMDEIVENFNEIPKGKVRSRYTQTQIVAGYLPQQGPSYSASENNNLPWMHSVTAAGSALKLQADAPYYVLGSTSEAPSDFPLNSERYKGYAEKEGLTAIGATGRDGIWIWELPLSFSNPIIIQDVMFVMEGKQRTISDYTTFSNYFNYGASAPPGKTANYGADDINIVVHVDSPFAKEKREYCLKEIASHNVQNYSKFFNRHNFIEGGTMADDMLPPMRIQDSGASGYDMGIINAIMFRSEDLNLPISRDSRIRLSLGIPNYLTQQIYSTVNAGAPNNQYYSVCLTILEEITGGDE